MSVLFNIADKIIGGNTVPDYATFRKRVLADGGTITDDAQLKEDMEWVWRYKPTWFASPAVRKTDKLYGAPTLDGTVVRATTKTGINADGLIGSRVAGELPWSYKDSRISFLPESARTNLLQRSEEFDNAYWTKDAETITPNIGIAPNNTTTADKTIALVRRTLALPDGTFSQSIFVKPIDTFVFSLNMETSFAFGNRATVTFDVESNTISKVEFGTYSVFGKIEPLSNGWFRLIMFGTTGAKGGDGEVIIRYIITGPDGIKSMFIWGAQLEVGSFASSYIPTTTTALTRNNDVLTVTGLEDIEGFYTEVNIRALSSARIIQAYGTDEEDGYFLLVTSDNRIRAEVRVLDVVTAFVQTAPVTDGNYDISVRWDGDLQLVVDGVLIGTDTPSSVPTGDDLKLGGNLNDTGFLNDSIYRTAGFIDATKLENIE
jgi:hypothetical protein